MDLMSQKLIFSGVISVVLLVSLFSATDILQNANAAKGSDIPGTVINSKYLSITEHRYRNGAFSSTINGTVINNSTHDVSFARVYAALYDKDNELITMDSGSVSVSSLPAGDTSPFTIGLFGIKDVDHYTLFPGGTPR
jgi:hypothetical protein